MFTLRTLLAAAPLLALAVAQNIAFTSVPAVVEAGESYNITWGGGDDTGVTVTLRRGNPQDLTTVDTLADNIMSTYYVWNVPSSIESGDDYALQITQGQSDINYSGLFTVEGGSAASASNSSSSTATATGNVASNATMSMTSMASASGTGSAIARNTTFSTASLTSTGTASFGESTTSRSTRTSAATTEATSAPSTGDAAIRSGSSVALVLGIVAAVMLH